MEARSPIEQQEVQLDEGDFIEVEAEGQDSEFPDDGIESESLMKKLEALQEKVKKQERKTKRLKAKNNKLKEEVNNQKEVTHIDPKIPLLMNVNVKIPKGLHKLRRSRAENLVKNCGICSKKEAGEPVTPPLSRKRSPDQEKCQMRDHPTEVHPKKMVPTERRFLAEEF